MVYYANDFAKENQPKVNTSLASVISKVAEARNNCFVY